MSISKIINVNDGSGRIFEENTVAELRFDVKPEVGSFNAVTSDAVARAVAGASGEVPQVAEDDNGKVLTAVYDAGGPAVEWGTGPAVDQTYDAESTNAQSGVAVASAIGTVNQVPASTSSDEGKVLTVDANGDTGWSTPAVPTVDQTYDGTSTNAQSGTAVAEAIADVRQVPASTSSDEGKVLTVDANGDTGWSTPAVPTVDQTYDGTSTNAQSGTAVAEAIADVRQVPASTGADEGKVLTVGASGVVGWDTVQAGDGTRLEGSIESYLWTYPDGSSAGVIVSPLYTNRLGHSTDYNDYNRFRIVSGSSATLMSVWEPAKYMTAQKEFFLVLGYNSYQSTVIPSGYKAAWCQDTGKTRYYVVESGATYPTSTKSGSTTIYYLSEGNRSISYSHYANVSIPYPPSVRPDYVPDATKYTKVGDWSSVTSDVHQWYLGFVNPSTGTWWTLPTETVGSTQYVRAGARVYYGLRVNPELPSLTGNAGKVLAVNSGATGTAWVEGITSYADITTGTAVLDHDNTVVTSTADITSVTVGAGVKQAVVQWTVSSTTTLPTVVDANSNPLKAASNNPSALTVGKTYQLSILNDCYVIAEFA